MAELTRSVVCAGCTGLIGQHLLPRLAAGHTLRVLSRDPERARASLAARLPATASVEYPRWDALDDPVDPAWFAGCSAVINLAGAGIADGRWTDRRKRLLRDSRLRSTTALATAAGAAGVPLINASAVGWYGSSEQPVDESAPVGDGFLAELCRDWEAATRPAASAGVRVVCLRIASVLAPTGGALAAMVRRGLPLARLGSGRQPFPWIQVDDVVGQVETALGDERWEGAINAVAPERVDHRSFMGTLSEVTGKWLVPISVPGWALRLALGEFASFLVSGADVVPARAEELGYVWRHPRLVEALRACVAEAEA